MNAQFRTHLTQQESNAVAVQILNRKNLAEQLKRQHCRRPLHVDRAALALGSQLAQKFQVVSSLTEQDLAFGWCLVLLEIVDRTAAMGAGVRENMVRPAAKPMRFTRRREVPASVEYVVERLHVPTYTSDQIQALEVTSDAFRKHPDSELIELHRLRVPLELSLGLPHPSESFWTRMRFPVEQHELCALIMRFVRAEIERSGSGEGYESLCTKVEAFNAGSADCGSVLLRALRYGLDAAWSELNPELAKRVLFTEGLRGGPPW